MAYSVRVSIDIPSWFNAFSFIRPNRSVTFVNTLSRFVKHDFFHTHVYLFAFASIFVPSKYTWSRSTFSSSNITWFISQKISAIWPVSSWLINWPNFMKDGPLIPSSNHIYRISVWQDFSNWRNEKYPSSINANNTIFSIFTASYLGRPTLFSFSLLTKYLFRSIRSITSLKLYTGSSISMIRSRSIGILSCFGVQ